MSKNLIRIVDGYVLLQRREGRTCFLGVPRSGERDFTPFENNGLVPFTKLRQAIVAAGTHLSKKHEGSEVARPMRVGKIHLEISHDRRGEAALSAAHDSSFVVVFGSSEACNILGARTPTAPVVFDCGGYLADGAEPFSELADAVRLRGEAERQGQCPAAVAFYRLRIYPTVCRKGGCR